MFTGIPEQIERQHVSQVGEEAVLLSEQTGETLLKPVSEFVELAREQTVKIGQ